MNTDEYFMKIYNRRHELSVTSKCIFYTDEQSISHSLIDILNIDEKLLNSEAKEFLEFLEKSDTQLGEYNFQFFKWKILAFVNLQDIFAFESITLNTNDNFHLLWYFYFESKRILKEMILSCIMGFNYSYNAMQRLFYEFNLLQCYYYNNTKKANNYSELERFLNEGIKPKTSSIIKNSIPFSPHQKKLNEFSNNVYNTLSQTSSHSYSPINSPFLNGSSSQNITIDNLYFWASLSPILDSVLWMYYSNFPMSFFPKDLTLKFGFDLPTGLYVDSSNGIVIKKSLSEEDYEMFYNYSKDLQEVEKLNLYYKNKKSLSKEEIISSCPSYDPKVNLLMNYIRRKAEFRATREILAIDHQKNINEINKTDLSFLEEIKGFSSFRKTKNDRS